MNAFVQFTTYKTYPLRVQVFDADGILKCTYDAPKGFVFHDYFQHLFSNSCVVYSVYEKGLQKFSIYTSHGGTLLEVHVAEYIECE